MKKQIMINLAVLCLITFFAAGIFADEFHWARVKFETKGKAGVNYQDPWDIHFQNDEMLMKEVEKMTTLKVSKIVDKVPLTDLDQMTNHPVLFMHGSGEPVFTQKELDNIKEYLKRGGFIYVDDCINFGQDDLFFRSMMAVIEKIFPDRKFLQLEIDHPIYSIHFDLPKGLVCTQEPVAPAMGMHDDKKRLMVLATCADIHCCWPAKYGKKTDTSIKMAINIIMYSLMH